MTERKECWGCQLTFRTNFKAAFAESLNNFKAAFAGAGSARTHTMIQSVLRDWDVQDNKKDRKMKAWETEKECTYVCWRQW